MSRCKDPEHLRGAPTVVALGDGAVHRTRAPALMGLTFSGKDGQEPNCGARGY